MGYVFRVSGSPLMTWERRHPPKFSKEHLQPAAKKLNELSWVSFQRLGDAELEGLPALPRVIVECDACKPDKISDGDDIDLEATE